MKLKAIKLRNFRSYREEVTIFFNDLTAFVGKNDIGKSTILEALDIFFNNGSGVIKLDKKDFNVYAPADDHYIRITAVFDNLPDSVLIDDAVSTSLGAEYLLNSDGDLEIIKEYRSETATGQKTFIKSNHPTNEECRNLLVITQRELQRKCADLNIEVDDRRVNSQMRQAIWNHYADTLQLAETELDVSGKNGELSSIWTNLQKYLPHYALFQADRQNHDEDAEVQDPMKIAVKRILDDAGIQQTLSGVADRIIEQLQDVADRTKRKLTEMNSELAHSLNPNINKDTLKWADVFKKISITGDDDIPLNKRGSGVKRMILLNFFRAEAERMMAVEQRGNIIYAIEEPETSQHIAHQILLVNALKQIANQPNAQIIITTHSADVVKELSFSDIRIITENGGNKSINNVARAHLPYVSLNEENYIAYDLAGIEYMNELYGFLQSKAIVEDPQNGKEAHFENWLVSHGLTQTKQWIRIVNGTPQPPQPATLQTYVRNTIHHPENNLNAPFTPQELRLAIEDMIPIVDSLR